MVRMDRMDLRRDHPGRSRSVGADGPLGAAVDAISGRRMPRTYNSIDGRRLLAHRRQYPDKAISSIIKSQIA
jgi:hypothetical protein